jgi:hypothetical protein
VTDTAYTLAPSQGNVKLGGNHRIRSEAVRANEVALLEYSSRSAYGPQKLPVTITTRLYSIVRLVQCKPE